MKLLTILMSAFAMLALAATAGPEPPKDPVVAAYEELIAKDLRLATIGYHLARGSAPFCRRTWRNPGWVLHDEQQYPDIALARRIFSFRRPVSIAALVAGGPAAQAGVEVGDGLLGSNGDSISYGADQSRHRATSERIDSIRQELAAKLAATAPLQLALETPAGARMVALDPPAICASDFWVDLRRKRDAGADGERVRVTSGLIDYVLDDDELAAVVAHEMAHNLLDHRTRIDAVRTGKTSVIRATEEEADRLSIWLMVNAGYDPQAAITFWQRYGKATDMGIFSAPTHHRWQMRVAMFRQEIAAINAVPAIGGLRDPPLLAAHRTQQ